MEIIVLHCVFFDSVVLKGRPGLRGSGSLYRARLTNPSICIGINPDTLALVASAAKQ